MEWSHFPFLSLCCKGATIIIYRTSCRAWFDISVGYAQLELEEKFIFLYYVDDTTTTTLMQLLKNKVLLLNLTILMCCAQCYNGASNMKKQRRISKSWNHVHYNYI